jgi:predicted amidohydrolase
MQVRAAGIQFEHRPGDKEANFATIARLAGEAAADGAQLIICPEMCTVGYWHLTKKTTEELYAVAEPVDGPSVTRIAGLAREFDAYLGAGFLEIDGDRLYNAYAVCSPTGEVHVHRKLHAFEHEAISSGDHYTVFPTPWGVKAGILICWDNNLIENVRATALLGASILIAPHQTGGTGSRSPYGTKIIPRAQWERRFSDPAAVEAEFRGPNGREWLLRWLPSRAHDNGLFLIFSNGVGVDDDEIRTGNAMIIDPYGRIVNETWAARDAVVLADLDLDLLPLSQGRRWMAGRRPELYGILTERTGAERDARAARFSTEPIPSE